MPQSPYGSSGWQNSFYGYGNHPVALGPDGKPLYKMGTNPVDAELSATNEGRDRAQQSFGRASDDRYNNLQDRAKQQGALEMMSDAAHGKAPSVANLQMQHGMAQNQMGQMGAANASRGNSGLAMAQRGAMGAGAHAQAQSIAAGGNARAAEMSEAQDAYHTGIEHARAGDQAMRAGSLKQSAGMNASDLAWFGARQNINRAQLDANTHFQGLVAGSYDAQAAREAQVKHDEYAAQLGMMEGAASAGMSAMGGMGGGGGGVSSPAGYGGNGAYADPYGGSKGGGASWNGEDYGRGWDRGSYAEAGLGQDQYSDENKKTGIRNAGSYLATMHAAMKGRY